MQCPQCDSTRHKTIQTRRCQGNAFLRKRICQACGAEWATTERIDRWDFHAQKWQGHDPAPELVLPKATAKPSGRATAKPASPVLPKATAFHPISMGQVAADLAGTPPAVCVGLIEWWNNSRRSKHGTAAAWTERAWAGSVGRVKKLPEWQQQLLVQAGIEHGWQSLNPEYIKDQVAKGPPRQPGFRPQSQGLAAALTILEGGAGGGNGAA